MVPERKRDFSFMIDREIGGERYVWCTAQR